VNALAFAASVISALAVLGVGYFGFVTQRRTGKVSTLDMQYSWALKRIEIVEKDLAHEKQRATLAEERANTFERKLQRCEESHQQTLVQNALLERLLDDRAS